MRKKHCGQVAIHRKDQERTAIHCVYQQKEKKQRILGIDGQ